MGESIRGLRLRTRLNAK